MVIQRKENTTVVFSFWGYGMVWYTMSMCLQGEKYRLFRMLLNNGIQVKEERCFS